VCRAREHQQSVCYPILEEVLKSKERPIQGNYPGVCLGGSYSSLVRRGVYNNGVSGPRPTTHAVQQVYNMNFW
jgi:hypothetical protein